MRGRDIFAKYRRAIMIISKIYGVFPLKLRLFLFEKHRNTRGKMGFLLRYVLLKSIAKQCGDNVSVFPGVYLLNPQNLVLGRNISIHQMSYIECGPFEDSEIRIDDNVSIAHGTTILATTHEYVSDSTDIIKDMPVLYKPVRICENVWIGAKTTVLYGVTIKSGCVIGANTVVTRSTEENGVYVGSPARKIKSRI